MPWPLSQDYNEAIQTPLQCFADPDLRQGEAVTNALGMPQPCSGNFADVYAVVSGQRKWAVKCFTRQIPGLRERYQEISAYLKLTPLPFMVDFTYLEQGVRIRGEWYPILKMQWVEGFTLNQFVKDNLDKPHLLDVLGQLWVRLAGKLRDAEMAHCDLQHGNVLLVPGSKTGSLAVKLVDYDGMCVPALTLLRSIELGHPNFQHPQRSRDNIYSLEVDRFSHLVIYTALRALIVGGKTLWDKYDNGDNLLFKAADFYKPGESPLFKELLASPDLDVRMLAEQMWRALAKPLDQTPLLEDVAAKLAPAAQTSSTPKSTTDLKPTKDVFAQATAGSESRKPPAKKKSMAMGLALAAIVGAIALAGGAGVFVLNGLGKTKPEEQVVQKGPQQPKENVPVKGAPPKKNPAETKKNPEPDPEQKSEPKPDPKPAPLPKTFKNSLGMEFVRVPKGKSWLGGGGGKPGDKEVVIPRDFYLGKYTVTQEQWESVMGNNPSSFSRNGKNKDQVKGISDAELKRFPVENVSWLEVQDFLNKLNASEKDVGWKCRLPTEAEWEYACRGGAASKADCGFDYYFDQPTNDLDSTQANFIGDQPTGKGLKGPYLARPCPVGSYKPNRLGLYDMNGNVRQWCDGLSESDGSGRSSPVIRGGSWHGVPENCRAAFRSESAPDERVEDRGFRLARVPVSAEKSAPVKPEGIRPTTWRSLANMPTARSLLAAVTGQDGRVYAIGGENASGRLGTVEVYDPSTNKWAKAAPMPTARNHLAATLGPDNLIYAIGGVSGIPKVVEAYNPRTNKWTTVAAMPTARHGLAAVTGPDGRIYAIGGGGPAGSLNTVEAYDPTTNTWATVSNMPTARVYLAAATGPDGRIYAIGGFVEKDGKPGKRLNTVEAYDAKTNKWTTVASMPTVRNALAAATGADGRIYAIGGHPEGGNLNPVEAYDPSTNKWTTVESMPTTRGQLAATTGRDGRIYVIGGGGTVPFLNTVEALSFSTSKP